MKPCGCEAACTQECRNNRAALRRASRLRARGITLAGQRPVNAQSRRPLKPSAALVLYRLQRGPASNRELMNLAGFGWACRVSEVRAAGYEIKCETLGPTPGMRTYTLLAGSDGREVTNGESLPGNVSEELTP